MPHHPGYPVFCMLGKAFSLLPLGEVAARTNLLSATSASSAVYVLYRLNLLMSGFLGGRAGLVSAAAALAFAAYPVFWAQAVVTEVYAMNALVVASLAYSAVRYHTGGGVPYLYITGLLTGLAFGCHHSAFFLLPGILVFLAADATARRDYKRVMVFLFFLAFGFSVNLYIPLRAHAGPALNIGGADDLGGLLWLSRWPMYYNAVSQKAGALPSMLTAGRAALGLAAAAAAAALVYTARDRRIFSFLFAAVLTYYLCVRMLAAGDVNAASMGFAAKFHIPAVMLLPAAFAAWLPGRLVRAPGMSRAAWPAAAAFIALAGFLGVSGFRDLDSSRNYYARDYCANALKSVSERGALFAWGDSEVFPAWYLMHVERYREDVMFIDTPLMSDSWYVRQAVPELARRYGVSYGVTGDLGRLQENILRLNSLLYGHAGVYYTYTAAHRLKLSWEGLLPQGLVTMADTGPRGQDPRHVWDRLVMRGGLRADTPRAQVAEDIFSIYGYQAFLWGEEALRRGRRDEARVAYNKAWHMGYRNPTVKMRLEGLGQGS
ncbi:MAG: DUF2723 domain-containing protein [Nitrospirae bacterium]|nr:DUF2723 domain-containing protein [Nitrospirota bacterium]